MVLQSQQSRSGATRSYMYAKRRRTRGPWFGIGLVLVVVVIGLWWVFGRDAGANANETNETQTNSPSTNSTNGSEANRYALNDPNANASLAGSDRSPTLPSSDRNDRSTRSTDTNNNRESGTPTDQNNSTDSSDPPAIVMGEPNRELKNGSGNQSQSSSGDSNSSNATPERSTRQVPRNPSPLGDNSYGPDPGPEVRQLMAAADEMVTRGELVEARRLYNEALHHPEVGRAAPSIRTQMGRINETVVFSPFIAENDPFVTRHVIKSGDRMVFLARDAHVEWQFLARINNIDDPGRIRAGQTLKIINGPFHAVVDKSDFRLDLYIGNADKFGRRMFVRSFPVGLGEYNSTPTGSWIVKSNKAINPDWANPRTGEHFKRDDPNNPIGEYWIGLRGLDPENSSMSGYGIHGTIEPESIGTQASMGCVRMHNDDVAIVYELLVSDQSTVIIKP